MSDNRQRSGIEQSAAYKDMSLEELERLMENSFYKGDADYETLKEMLTAYKERQGSRATDATATWDDFQKNYAERKEKIPLPFELSADNPKQTVTVKKQRKPVKWMRLLRVGEIAASIIAFFLLVDTFAFGGQYRRSFIHWSSELMSSSDNVGNVQIDENLRSLHKALKQHDISEKLAPVWVPDGFIVKGDTLVDETPTKVVFSQHLASGTRSLLIQIVSFRSAASSLYEVDDGVVIYTRNGINHSIAPNEDKVLAYWTNGNFECYIIGDITVEDAERMINSVYER